MKRELRRLRPSPLAVGADPPLSYNVVCLGIRSSFLFFAFAAVLIFFCPTLVGLCDCASPVGAGWSSVGEEVA